MNRQDILDNIDIEAKLFVTKGKPMSERGPQWDDDVTAAIIKWQAQIPNLAAQAAAAKLAKRQANLLKKKQARASKAGMTLDAWEAQAKKYYTIDPTTFIVTSTARSPNTTPQEWPCADKIDAEEKVIELIDFKYYDHFLRTDRDLADFAH